MRLPAAPATMLSTCDMHWERSPALLIDVHVDFDMALPSGRGGMSGSRPAALQHCMGSVAVTVIIKLKRLQKGFNKKQLKKKEF